MNVTIQTNIDEKLKNEVENIIQNFGCSLNDIVSATFNQIRLQQSIPLQMQKNNIKLWEDLWY